MHSFGINPIILDCEIGPPEIINIPLLYGVKCYFDMLNRLGVDHEYDRQTNKQMDRHFNSKCRA